MESGAIEQRIVNRLQHQYQQQTPKVRKGSSTVLQHPFAQRLECDDEPTFGSGGRQCGGEQTLRRGEAKVGFVP
jgi:hypothetical protein